MTATRVVIFGHGDHARVVRDAVDLNPALHFVAYFDRAASQPHDETGAALVHDVAGLKALCEDEHCSGVVGVGSNFVREKIVQELLHEFPEFQWTAVVHPAATISPRATIGAGAFVNAGAIVNTGAVIGPHALVNTGAIVDHDCRLGAYSSLGPGVALGGNVRLGEAAYVGIGASVKHGVQIGDDTVLGAGAYAHRDCVANAVYMGVPARQTGTRDRHTPYL